LAIWDAYKDLARADGTPELVGQLQKAGWRIGDAAHLGLSIDNVINQFDHDALIPLCAKLAIARQIIRAESKSQLLPKHNPRGGVDLQAIRGTWLGRFAQLLVQDKTHSALTDIFSNISIVSFNYDRLVRYALPAILASQFGISLGDAREIAKSLKIYHPYGRLGPLPWESPDGEGIEFGAEETAPLLRMWQNLRTFTEQIDEKDDLAGMYATLSSANRIVFLGFGYHRQNMELLTRGLQDTSAKSVYGTSLGLSASDRDGWEIS
jgi:hypothetical protein